MAEIRSGHPSAEQVAEQVAALEKASKAFLKAVEANRNGSADAASRKEEWEQAHKAYRDAYGEGGKEA